jgi:hypothetical protein
MLFGPFPTLARAMSSRGALNTVLHLLGLDHEKLTFRHNGANRRLTDVHWHVIKEILA